MRFACLGYLDEKKWDAMSRSEQDAMVEECFAYDSELLKNGNWIDGGQALQNAQTAKTLRLKNGKLVVTDGPFVETKETLGGIGILEATDMAHAVQLMSQHPGVRYGFPFEIRPVDEVLNERCQSEAPPASPSLGKKFVCLGCSDESVWNAMSKEKQEAMLEECVAYDEVLRRFGRVVGGEALQTSQTARTIRLKGGKVIVTDGPYAETKEQVGGLAVCEFQDMDQAIQAWSNHPCLRMGDALELRPVDEEFNAKWDAHASQGTAEGSSV
jgi:hypothetical protein